MATGIFAGSFDPFTTGHLDIVERAARVFSEVYVAVLNNSQKRCAFSPQERVAQVDRAVSALPNVSVISFNGLLVECMREHNIDCTIRGIRSAADFDYERGMAQVNSQLWPEMDTVVFLARPRYMHISSSIVKELASYGACIDGLVPKVNESEIVERMRNNGRERGF
ncbi:MAG: pantetheine-phosphate adenylyltransferase [Clostridia bacterium]|nr:pantetheine-phosphate adenylyltransferase [Clostridia bacterium]